MKTRQTFALLLIHMICPFLIFINNSVIKFVLCWQLAQSASQYASIVAELLVGKKKLGPFVLIKVLFSQVKNGSSMAREPALQASKRHTLCIVHNLRPDTLDVLLVL